MGEDDVGVVVDVVEEEAVEAEVDVVEEEAEDKMEIKWRME